MNCSRTAREVGRSCALWLAAVLLLAVLALYAVSWRVSVAWYGKYKK